LQKIVAADLQVIRYVIQDSRQGSNLQRIVRRNGNVMLGWIIDGEPNMAAGLARYAITYTRLCFNKLGAGQVPRQSHAAMTSSRTK
jgi:hypothetical protein